MEKDCKYCDESFDSKKKLKTHMAINHRDEVSSEELEELSRVSEGHLKEREHETGEQFGYR